MYDFKVYRSIYSDNRYHYSIVMSDQRHSDGWCEVTVTWIWRWYGRLKALLWRHTMTNFLNHKVNNLGKVWHLWKCCIGSGGQNLPKPDPTLLVQLLFTVGRIWIPHQVERPDFTRTLSNLIVSAGFFFLLYVVFKLYNIFIWFGYLGLTRIITGSSFHSLVTALNENFYSKSAPQ